VGSYVAAIAFIAEDQVFDLDRFIEYCRAAVLEDPNHRATREVVARANSDPAAVLAALGKPTRVGVTPVYKSNTLTVLNVVWGKRDDDHAAKSPHVGSDRCAYRP
jgi:hypothetical protein